MFNKKLLCFEIFKHVLMFKKIKLYPVLRYYLPSEIEKSESEPAIESGGTKARCGRLTLNARLFTKNSV